MIDETKRERSLCFTGHRTEKLPQTKEGIKALENKILCEIDKAIANGIDTFYFGACYGFDLMAAEQVLKRSKLLNLRNPKPIRLIAVIPFEEQAIYWLESDREKYYDEILPYCDEVITLNTKFKKGCYHERNRYIVDRSSRMIAYYDGSSGGTAYTVKYAETKGLDIKNLY